MKVSVITINYNNREGLRKTIESVVNQSYEDFEFIVIDGASTDGSVDVIYEYMHEINCWVSERDNGIYHAMNKGIDKANGEYCVFMNSGDCFYDNMVLKQVDRFLDGTSIIYGNTHYSNGLIRKSINEPPLFSFFYVNSFSHQSTFIQTALLKKYKYDENLKIVSDWKFFLQTLIIDNCTYKNINVVISLYDASGISSTNKVLYEKERLMVLKSMFPQRQLLDYHRLIYGERWDEKLYVEMKRSKYKKVFYTINVSIIKILSFFKRNPSWIRKYPLILKI